MGPQVTAGLSTVCVPSEGSLGRDRAHRLDRGLRGGQRGAGGRRGDLQSGLSLVEHQVHLVELALRDGPVGNQQADPWNGTHQSQSRAERGMREKPPSTPGREHKESGEQGEEHPQITETWNALGWKGP